MKEHTTDDMLEKVWPASSPANRQPARAGRQKTFPSLLSAQSFLRQRSSPLGRRGRRPHFISKTQPKATPSVFCALSCFLWPFLRPPAPQPANASFGPLASPHLLFLKTRPRWPTCSLIGLTPILSDVPPQLPEQRRTSLPFAPGLSPRAHTLGVFWIRSLVCVRRCPWRMNVPPKSPFKKTNGNTEEMPLAA